MQMKARWTVAMLVWVSVAFGCNSTSQQQVTSSPDAVAVAATYESDPQSVPQGAPVVPTDDINPPPDEIPAVGSKLELTEEQWRERLTDTQFDILRNAGTEFPGTGAYDKFYEDGTYHCSACNNPMFDSEAKFDSKTGWPSFYQPIDPARVVEVEDRSHGMTRTEVRCAVCGGHLGHVFEDGPKPTGLRYCLNSASLYFRPADSETDVTPTRP